MSVSISHEGHVRVFAIMPVIWAHAVSLLFVVFTCNSLFFKLMTCDLYSVENPPFFGNMRIFTFNYFRFNLLLCDAAEGGCLVCQTVVTVANVLT